MSTALMAPTGFIKEKDFCPDCKSKMILSKNQRGTAYIRCSNKNRKHMEYLTPDLMNFYETRRNLDKEECILEIITKALQ